MAAKHATVVQTAAVLDDLKEVIIKADKDGEKRCLYKDDESDHTVAERTGVASSVVSRIRVGMYGLLAHPEKPKKAPAAGSIAALEARVAWLESIMKTAFPRLSQLTEKVPAPAE